jgi:transcriptional regulator with XRE-family HTH domain
MTKKHDNREFSPDEKDLERIENALRSLASDGELDFPVTEEMLRKYQGGLSPEVGHRIWEQVRFKRAVAERFKAFQGRKEADQLSFPELLQGLRTKAGVSVDELARAVRLRSVDITGLERGQADPLKASASVMATLMEICWLPLSLVEQSLKHLLATRAVRTSLSGVSARSTGQVTDEDYEKAFRDVASHVAEKQKVAAEMALPDGYLEALRDVLKQRGRTDLL